jgi:predicted MPP superfamily phosphohydrolase
MRLVWLTDIHVNFVSAQTLDRFFVSVRDARPDALLIGGDIAEGHDLIAYLERIADAVPVPMHFVLGNHDYYRSSIATVRREVVKLCTRRPQLNYLSRSSWLALDDNTALLGHDGWGDGREGDYARSPVVLNDNHFIKELSRIDRDVRGERLGDLGGHEGRLSDASWTPFFVCKAAGSAIERVMRARPDKRVLVLCGHTHGGGEAWPLPNVRVATGAAEYGEPGIAGVITNDLDLHTGALPLRPLS